MLGAHGIAGEQQHSVLDPVADERPLVLAEEVLLVGAKLEEGQRVRAVAMDELGGGGAGVGTGQPARGGERAEHDVPDRQQRACDDGAAGEMVMRGTGEFDADEAGERQERHPPQRRAQRDRLAQHPEAGAAGQEHERGSPGDRGLLKVETLEQVEQAEGEHQADRDLPGAAAAFKEIRGDEQERQAGGKRQRVEQAHRLDRLDLEQHVTAPADVRSQRRADIDDADKGRSERSQAGQPA